MKTELLTLFNHFDVISFDIFDTLLLRPYLRPTDLFRKVRGETFVQKRIAAERTARKEARIAGREEVTYDEIYAKLPQWSDVKVLELEEEKRCLIANPEIVKVYMAAKAAGKKVVIASDMYLPRPFLEDVLRGQGIDGWDAFYLSSDCGVQKETGRLFRKIVDDFGIEPGKMLHIGDNEFVDVKPANEMGIVAYCYPKVREQFFEENPFALKFLEKSADFASQCLVGALALGWHLFKCKNSNHDYWQRLGYLFAGTMGYGFVSWLVGRARAQGFSRLLMAARDGYVWQKIVKAIAPDIRTDYVYWSRKSTLFTTKYLGSTEYVQKKRRRFCLGIVSEQTHKKFGVDACKRYIEEGEFTPEMFAAFSQFAEPIKTEMSRYFESLRIDPETTALVDGCSKHFTIQRFLKDAYDCDLQTYYFQTDTLAPHGETFWLCPWDMARFLYLAEFVFSAPTTSVSTIKDCKPVWNDLSEQHFFEQFKISVSERMSEAAVDTSILLDKFVADVNVRMLKDWIDAFFENLSPSDRQSLSFARDSLETANEGAFQSLVRDYEYDRKRVRIFGHTLLLIYWRFDRQTFSFKRVVSLFGRIPLLSVKRWWWSGK